MRLSPHQRIIAWRLALQGSASTEELLRALYGNDPDGGPHCAIEVLKNRVCFLRKSLAPHGIEVLARWGFGYQVRESQRDQLLSILAKEIEVSVMKRKLTLSQYIQEAA